MFQDLTSLVVNIGTYSTQIGYGGDDSPKITCASYIGKCASDMLAEGSNQGSRYLVGDKFLSLNKPEMEIESIFKHFGDGKYQYDYEKLEHFLTGHFHDNLHVALHDYSLLFGQDMAAKPHQLRQQRAKIAQLMFEKFKIANIYFCKNPVLSCFATGRSTALVLDSGQTYTRVVSVHDGYALQKTAKTVPIGGKTISKEIIQYIQKITGKKLCNKYMLDSQKHRVSFNDFHTNQLLRDIKENISYRPSQQIQDAAKIEYELPDRSVITIDKNQLVDPFIDTAAFNMKSPISDVSYKGIPNMIIENINACDVDIKKELYSNLLLTGGNILYGNLMQNIKAKVAELAPPNAKVRDVALCTPGQRKYTEFIGGSIVTSLSSFQGYWVGQQEWKQGGSTIIEKKCT